MTTFINVHYRARPDGGWDRWQFYEQVPSYVQILGLNWEPVTQVSGWVHTHTVRRAERQAEAA